MQPPLSPPPRCPGAPGPRLFARPSREHRLRSSPRFSHPLGAGSCISSSSREAGSGLGEVVEEGGSLHQGRRREAGASPSLLSTRGGLGSSAWALLMTLGRPLCATSPGRAARVLPIPGARGRSSGRSRGAGLGRRGALLARGTQQPAHGGPLERPGAPLTGKKRAGSPGSSGRCQLEPAAGRVRTRGCLPWGPFPPGQERSLRGPGATTRGGGTPMPGPEAGRPGCLMLVVAPASRHCAPRQKQPKSHRLPQDRATAAPANSLPMRPLPRPRRWRARPGERPHSSPTPGTRRSSAPSPNSLQPPALGPRAHTPPARPSAAGTTSPPRSSSPPGPAGRGGAAGELTRSPSPGPERLRPWLRQSVPEPQLPVRRQKRAEPGRQPPRRPSAPPRRRGLSSREVGGHAHPAPLPGEGARPRVPGP